VASLLDIMDVQSYEGEAAMHLEVVARKYFKEHGYEQLPSYYQQNISAVNISVTSLASSILLDIKNGAARELIAARFHGSLVNWIEAVANQEQFDKIAFSGGVFQNTLLVDLIITRLKKKFKLYFHEQLSPNDENISFGQLINYEIQQKLLKKA